MVLSIPHTDLKTRNVGRLQHPEMANFKFHVLVAGLPVPEYRKGRRVLIECNLFTPVSYKQKVRELVYGEVEEQEWPVTPYEVRVETTRRCPISWFYLYVDGVEVNGGTCGDGSNLLFRGIRGSEGTRELLFALPRFARDEDDRVEGERATKAGTIEVVQHRTTYRGVEWYEGVFRSLEQFNKKDAEGITKGKYTMATSKEGRMVERYWPRNTTIWDIGGKVRKQTKEYHMTHTLQDMGIQLKQMDWSQAPNAAIKVDS